MNQMNFNIIASTFEAYKKWGLAAKETLSDGTEPLHLSLNKEKQGEKYNKEIKDVDILPAIRNLIWMARRYAEGRMSFAPDMFNESYDVLKKVFDFDETKDPDNRTDEYRPIKNFPYATRGEWGIKPLDEILRIQSWVDEFNEKFSYKKLTLVVDDLKKSHERNQDKHKSSTKAK